MGQVDGYRALCALGADKPFECVGTVAESRAAMARLAAHPDWSRFKVVAQLAPELPESSDSLDSLMATGGPHCIPPEIFRRVAF